jgi:hypothetical protein
MSFYHCPPSHPGEEAEVSCVLLTLAFSCMKGTFPEKVPANCVIPRRKEGRKERRKEGEKEEGEKKGRKEGRNLNSMRCFPCRELINLPSSPMG